MNQWTKDLPAEPGWYAWQGKSERWYPVRIVVADTDECWKLGVAKGDLCISGDQGLYPLPSGGAWWCKLELPPVPVEGGNE